MDELARRYLCLAFGVERHIPGFVDAYFGPEELRSAALAGEPPAPGALLDEARALAEDVRRGDYPRRRRDYLAAQIRALEAVCRKLSGLPLSYADEVRACFDVEPRQTPDDLLLEAVEQLDALLPGRGSVAERMQHWRARFVVGPALARRLVDVIAAEVRHRTQALIALPAGESVGFELVSDKPWSGYNWYLGAYRSRVELNTDLPIHANGLTALICHEAYPGHHTEHAVKERRFYREQGFGEHCIQLIAAPECVISEGIAMLADRVVFPDGELYAWQAAQLYPLAGIVGEPEREREIAQATRVLRALSANAALLLHGEGASEDEVLAYIRRYGLRNEQEARQSLRFIGDPLWRAYVFTYHSGQHLLGEWLRRGDDLQERFRVLLTEQVTPSLVEQWLLAERNSCPQ
jgi:hypothetical protein